MADIDRARRPEERVVQIAAPAYAEASAGKPDDTGRPSIAVLPFANMSGDPEQEYFADGMVEEIITGLSRIRWLTVIARNSSFAYKGKSPDVRAVGRELNVRYVLEGSVRKAGDKVRITGQLIEAESGGHLWADKFDGSMADVFDLQDQITAAVVGAIEPSVQKAEIERAKRKRPDNLDAYDLYLRALAHLYSRTHESAIALLDRALEIDPNYVEAHGLAARCHELLFAGGGGGEPARAAAIVHARAVQSLGSDNATTLTFAGIALHSAGHDGEAALGLIERAFELNPNSAMVLSFGAMVNASQRRLDTALAWAERSLRLAPLDDPSRTMAWLATTSVRRQQGDYEAALAAARQVLQISARIMPAHVQAIGCLVRLGRMGEARAAAQRLIESHPDFRVAHFNFATPGKEDILADLRAAGLRE